MKNRIIYHLINNENQKFEYAEFLHNELKSSADELVIMNIDNKNINFDCVNNIISTEKSHMLEYNEIIFVSDAYFGPFYDFSEFLNNINKNGAEIFSIYKAENNLPDFNFLYLKSTLIEKQNIDLENISLKCKYLIDDKNAKTIYNYLVAGKLPIVEKTSMVGDYKDIISSYTGEYLKKILKYVKDETSYDVNIIWENIISEKNMADIVYNCQCMKVLPKYLSDQEQKQQNNVRKAVIIHIYYEDLIDECYQYVKNVGKDFDVFVTTDTNEKIEKVRKIFGQSSFNKLETILIENRGRDVSALLTGCKDFIMDYDLACFVHDKKVKQLKDEMVGSAFSSKCYENVLGSKNYVKNIVKYFDMNPKLGMVFPPPPNHGDYYPTLGYFDWGNNYSNVKELYDILELKIDISDKKEAVAPLGTMFWFRPEALKDLFKHDWKYEDFPPEPNPNDGTILHAIERIYPFCCQNAGYYVSWIMNDEYAGTELNNLYYMIKSINKKIFKKYGAGNLAEICNRIDNNQDDHMQKELDEYAKVASFYKVKAEESEKAAKDFIELSNAYKEKSDDFEKTLHETQELLKVINAQKEDYQKRFEINDARNRELESRNNELENENSIINTEINNMKATKIWRFRNFVRRILGKK